MAGERRLLKQLKADVKTKSVIDPELETEDPTPDIEKLFRTFNKKYFRGKLNFVKVEWCKNMFSSAGMFNGNTNKLLLSAPLLKLRPRKDLIETLLHEMIHAYVDEVLDIEESSHGSIFHMYMEKINKETGAKITSEHDFFDEINYYKTHWWRCNGPCSKKYPYFGLVRKATGREPGFMDYWFNRHKTKCGGEFIKVKEPSGYRKLNEPKTNNLTELVNDNSKNVENNSKKLNRESNSNKETNVNQSSKVGTGSKLTFKENKKPMVNKLQVKSGATDNNTNVKVARKINSKVGSKSLSMSVIRNTKVQKSAGHITTKLLKTNPKIGNNYKFKFRQNKAGFSNGGEGLLLNREGKSSDIFNGSASKVINPANRKYKSSVTANGSTAKVMNNANRKFKSNVTANRSTTNEMKNVNNSNCKPIGKLSNKDSTITSDKKISKFNRKNKETNKKFIHCELCNGKFLQADITNHIDECVFLDLDDEISNTYLVVADEEAERELLDLINNSNNSLDVNVDTVIESFFKAYNDSFSDISDNKSTSCPNCCNMYSAGNLSNHLDKCLPPI